MIALLLIMTAIGIKLKNDLSPKRPEVPTVVEPTVTEEPETEENPDKDTLLGYAIEVKSNMDNVSGDCQWGFKVYPSGLRYSTDSFKAPSASVIKIFIMEYAYDLIENGELSLDETISGSSVRNLLNAMITRSDNSATNVFIDEFGMEKMNSFFKEKGYSDTKLERRMLDTNAMQAGKDNYTSVDDVMKFLDKLYENRDTYPYSDMLAIMKKQQVKTKIRDCFRAML